MLQAQASERELLDQFLAALRALPEVRAELEGPGAPELDARLALEVAGNTIHALVELRKAVYPRDVRQLVWRIRDLARQNPAGTSGGEPLAVLVAESISPGAKDLLRTDSTPSSRPAAGHSQASTQPWSEMRWRSCADASPMAGTTASTWRT